MTFALFQGCKIPYFCPEYGASTKAVLGALDVDFTEPEFNCCGYPVRHLDVKSHLFQAARNFAIAEEQEMDLLTPCKCCFGSLAHARHFLSENAAAKDEINGMLAKEKRTYRGVARVRHLLSVLKEDVGVERIISLVQKPYRGLKVAAHYGCHALRPSNVVAFDDPMSPTIFEALITATGAETVQWAKRLECCGQPAADKNPALSQKLAENKIASAEAAGADLICSACTYCQMQFDAMPDNTVPSILYPQLLGLSMGLSEKKLGLTKDTLGRQQLERFIAA